LSLQASLVRACQHYYLPDDFGGLQQERVMIRRNLQSLIIKVKTLIIMEMIRKACDVWQAFLFLPKNFFPQTSMIRRTAVRETSVSASWGKIEGTPEKPQTSRRYGIEGLRGASLCR